MHDHQLNRVLKLVKRTGDKLVILDQENDEASVLMGLGDYEELLSGGEPLEDLNEREMLDRVNRDLGNWRAYHEFDDEKEVMDMENDEVTPEVIEKAPQEESLADVTAEEEEEKFYLEPVE